MECNCFVTVTSKVFRNWVPSIKACHGIFRLCKGHLNFNYFEFYKGKRLIDYFIYFQVVTSEESGISNSNMFSFGC